MWTHGIIPDAILENNSNPNFNVILNLKENLSEYLFYSTVHIWEFSFE